VRFEAPVARRAKRHEVFDRVRATLGARLDLTRVEIRPRRPAAHAFGVTRHSAIGRQTPAERLNNLLGSYN
jgi:hypothetical protein